MEDWQKQLISWYNAGHRELPWRQTHDPYRIWISEIMLQQTRVEVVIGYYQRFLEAFPTVEVLAAAPVDTVLKYWEGLGYYSRARNLHKAAGQIVAAGGFPQEYEGIRALSGIGEYTAGAICSIAYNKKAAAVDGNVLRLISRLYAIDTDIMEESTRRRIREIVWAHVPEEKDYEYGPCAYTQSLMELGATVCIPKYPRCAGCPLQKECQAYSLGRTSELPIKKKKERQRVVNRYIGIVERTHPLTGQREILMRRRPEKGLLRGLWEYPGVDANNIEEMKDAFARELRLPVEVKGRLLEAEHIFTHRHWKMQVYEAALCGAVPEEGEWCWASVDRQKELMIPTAFRRIQEYLAEPEQLSLVE